MEKGKFKSSHPKDYPKPVKTIGKNNLANLVLGAIGEVAIGAKLKLDNFTNISSGYDFDKKRIIIHIDF